MESYQYVKALLTIFDVETKKGPKADIYKHHLTSVGFTEAEAGYALERFKKAGYLDETGFFSTYYRLGKKGVQMIDQMASKLEDDMKVK